MRKSLVISALLAGALTVTSICAFGQTGSYLNLGTIGDSQVYVGSGSNAQRVGSGVLMYVHQLNEGFSSSAQVLASCEGSWLSSMVRFVVVEALSTTSLEQKVRAKADEIPIIAIEFSDWQQSDLPFAAALKSNIKAICKGAAPEPRNVAITIASFQETAKTPSGSISLLTGSVLRKGSTMEVWLRTTHTKYETVVIGGKPWVIDGVTQTRRVATGPYEMRKVSFNCVERQVAISQYLAYDKDGSISDQASIPKEKVQFFDVVPNSNGESQLEAVCRIYGGKGS